MLGLGASVGQGEGRGGCELRRIVGHGQRGWHTAGPGAIVASAILMGTLFANGTAGAASSATHPPRGETLDAARPKVTTEQLPKIGGASESIKVFSWNIPAHHYVTMPEWYCPSGTPYFKTNGVNTQGGTIYQADIRVEASDGVGYRTGLIYVSWKNITVRNKPNAAETLDPRVPGQTTVAGYPIGFQQGNFASNSIWAPIFKGGTFRMWVTCTSSLSDAAFNTRGDETSRTLPWSRTWE